MVHSNRRKHTEALMQGKRSAVGSLPDSINFDYGSTPSNVGIDQQICWNNVRDPAESRLPDFRISASNTDTYMSTVGQEDRRMSRWNVGEASSSNLQNLVNHGEQTPQNPWSSSMGASASNGLALHEYETSNNFLGHNVDLNMASDDIVNEPFVQSSNGGPTSQTPDINVGILDHVGGDHIGCPHLSKSSGLENKSIHPGSSSSNPFPSSSHSGDFLMDEDDTRPGYSLDGRRLSCKRKALEGHVGQSSNGGDLFPSPEGSTIWQPVPPRFDAGSSLSVSTPENSVCIGPSEQGNQRLGLDRGGIVSERLHAPIVARGESSRRNYRMRINPLNLPDPVANNSFIPGATTRRPDVPHVHQRLRFVPANPPLDLMSPAPPDNAPPQNQSLPVRMPALHRHAHNLRWSVASNLRAGSSGPVAPGERDVTLPEDLNSRTRLHTIADHPMFAPALEVRNSGQNPTNVRSNNASGGLSSNAASSSRYRFSDFVRRSLISSVGPETGGQSSNASVHRSLPGSSQDVGLPTGAGNQGHSQSHPRSALLMERHGDGVIGLPYSLRTLAAGEGRNRVTSEQIRHLLEAMRRGEGLRFEDLMILDQSVLFGMADIHDQHRDMRLDVDNMSYEELLALEERIGNVCTGLSEEKIMKHMKQSKYFLTIREDQADQEPCSVCQEEYKEGDDLGTLDCGHDFHTECVKQWLAQKNICPICKTTALSTT